jgi:hypothetical protein
LSFGSPSFLAAADLAQDALEPEATAIFEDHGESSPENGLRRRLQCLKTDEWCTGPGVGDKKCCSGLECRLKPGSDADGPKQCLSPPRPPTCLKTGEWCTGPGVGSKKCCSGLICRLKAGDDLDGPKQCLRCVKRNQRCYRNVDCCGAMKCRTSGQIKKCS